MGQYLLGKAKIGDPHMPIQIQKKIFRFQIPIQNVQRVEIPAVDSGGNGYNNQQPMGQWPLMNVGWSPTDKGWPPTDSDWPSTDTGWPPTHVIGPVSTPIGLPPAPGRRVEGGAAFWTKGAPKTDFVGNVLRGIRGSRWKFTEQPFPCNHGGAAELGPCLETRWLRVQAALGKTQEIWARLQAQGRWGQVEGIAGGGGGRGATRRRG